MKKYLMLLVSTLIGCGQSLKNDQQASNQPVQDSTKNIMNNVSGLKRDSTENIDNEKNKYQLSELEAVFKDFKLINLEEPIMEDLNGDGVRDKAVFTSQNGKSGIIITDGKTQQEVKIGLGAPFEEMGDDFSWVDYWAVVKDSATYEVIIIDSEIVGDTTVRLANPSIIVRKEEAGGGVITFRNGKYEWIHQAD